MSDLAGWPTCLAGGSIGTEEGKKDYEPKSYRIRLYLDLDLGLRWMT